MAYMLLVSLFSQSCHNTPVVPKEARTVAIEETKRIVEEPQEGEADLAHSSELSDLSLAISNPAMEVELDPLQPSSQPDLSIVSSQLSKNKTYSRPLIKLPNIRKKTGKGLQRKSQLCIELFHYQHKRG